MKLTLILLGVLIFPAICQGQQKVNFNRDIRPILSDRCYHCHGPNEEDRQADLRLDQTDDDGNLQAITPGSIDDSELWHRITGTDDDMMPPPDSSKAPLTDEEKETIKRWIEEGAEYSDFWAFVPPRKPARPDLKNQKWSDQPIDQFVLKRLESEGLTPSPPADRRTLIRRLSLDLTGLPPTREEIRGYLDDSSDDSYERLVDRLLAKPQYGEHMTKYWLDLVRFADTNGMHHDHYRDMTPYRDWVIRSFNGNLPYNEFVKYQLAGDLYPEPTRDQLIATGFNRLHLIIDVGTALPEESKSRNVIDRVTAVGTAFMGLTIQCAVCHDHKYDPITMTDFYAMSAFFNNLDAAPETGHRQGNDFRRGLQSPYISLASPEQQQRIDSLNHLISETSKQVGQIEKEVSETKDETYKKTLEIVLNQVKQSLKTVQEGERSLGDTIPFAMVMKEKSEPTASHILIRGAYDDPGEIVERNTPRFLPAIGGGKLKTRMDLAEWFVADENPLTARVAVNRFWQQLFGIGIVKTSEDFGAQGEWPSHPEVLDYLSASFVESGWDLKALMKQIVMSKTYQQSSKTSPDQKKADPDNRLLARGSRFRLDSEMIRDQVLATSGLLNHKLYGKSVKPPQPAGLWKTVNMPTSYPYSYVANTDDNIYRRSLYTFWKRGMPPPQMTILNAPAREACIARRERTNTPLQALLLLNEPEYLKAARNLAHATLADTALNPSDRLAAVYETITSRTPDAVESKDFLTMVEDLKTIYLDSPALADQLCAGVELREGESKAELAAWTMLISTIYNLDITKMRG